MPSRAVTVTVTVLLPELATRVGADTSTSDSEVDTTPGTTFTVGVCASATAFAVAEMVFSSAVVDWKLPVVTPSAFVGAGAENEAPSLGVAASTTAAP